LTKIRKNYNLYHQTVPTGGGGVIFFGIFALKTRPPKAEFEAFSAFAASKPADWRESALVRVGDVENFVAANMVKPLKTSFLTEIMARSGFWGFRPALMFLFYHEIN
jgi:hypothetical protein